MIRGRKFELDLGSDDETESQEATASLSGAFVTDVLERQPGVSTAPSAPKLKSKTGFPEHKKRPVQSRFKQQSKTIAREPQSDATAAKNDARPPLALQPSAGGNLEPKSWVEEEKRRIDEENRQKLAAMSPSELTQEREELLSSLSPAMIQRLLARSNIDSGSNEQNLEVEHSATDRPYVTEHEKTPSKSVSFTEPVGETPPSTAATESNEDLPESEALPHDSIHFPRPPQPPDLDPSSETFLDDLHQKYFPSLPTNPDKLEWMQSTKADNKSYDPASTALHAKDIRFSFNGELIPPKTAAEIPVTAGLHHHGDAPDAAGYTIAELAHLARSSYAAQRCIAFQTLGRLLYRLGKGEFGDAGEPGADLTGEDSFGELARGLWHEVEKEKVIETLVLESEGHGAGRGRHVSAKAYATEAVHLWRKGGGRRW